MNKKHVGSSFDDFLKKEGILEQIESAAIKRVVACQLADGMQWNTIVAKNEETLSLLAKERGFDWGEMSEDEREKFVDDLMHE